MVCRSLRWNVVLNPLHHDIFRNLLVKAIIVHFFVNDSGNHVKTSFICVGAVIFDENSFDYVGIFIYIGEDIASSRKRGGGFIPLWSRVVVPFRNINGLE